MFCIKSKIHFPVIFASASKMIQVSRVPYLRNLFNTKTKCKNECHRILYSVYCIPGVTWMIVESSCQVHTGSYSINKHVVVYSMITGFVVCTYKRLREYWQTMRGFVNIGNQWEVAWFCFIYYQLRGWSCGVANIELT